jgi:hypothetical protein
MAYVYHHIRLDTNDVFYVGIGSNSNYRRAYNKSSRPDHWKRIIKKHGYRVEIIHDNLEWSDACKKEIDEIFRFGRLNTGKGQLINLTDGGEGTLGNVITPESKLKMSQSRKGIVFSQITKDRISIANTGKKLSKETCLKMSIANKGRVVSDETRKKSSIARKGIKLGPQSLEHRQFMSNKFKGRLFTDEWKKNIKKSAKGRKMPPPTEIHRLRISEALKGRKHTPEALENMRIAAKSRKNKAA